jgi:hypothetical protein
MGKAITRSTRETTRPVVKINGKVVKAKYMQPKLPMDSTVVPKIVDGFRNSSFVQNTTNYQGHYSKSSLVSSFDNNVFTK